MRERRNQRSIADLKVETEGDLEAVRADLRHLTVVQTSHIQDTTDRLARIETTLNLVAQKVLSGE